MKKLIVVADWASDSLTCQEVRSGIEGRLEKINDSNISFVASEPSTIHTAFLQNQIIEVEERIGKPLELVLFQNTDTRLQSDEGVEKAQGAEFIVVQLYSGVWVCGPNSGYNFSMIRSKIDKLFQYDGLSKGSQFRSRDLYSLVAARLMEGKEKSLPIKRGSLSIIPTLQGDFVAHIDNFGNIKTTITQERMKSYQFGDMISVIINHTEKKVKYVSNLFGGKPGELVIYPGSSGQKYNPFLEISVWRHHFNDNPTTGAANFNNPKPGTHIGI